MIVQSTWVSILFSNYLEQGYSLSPSLLFSYSLSLSSLFLFFASPSPLFLFSSFFLHFSFSFWTFFLLYISPITEAYHSACQFVSQAGFNQHIVTRTEYAENGSNASRKKFRDWKPQESEKEKPKEASKLKGKQREDDRTQVSARMTRTRRQLGTSGTATTTTSSSIRKRWYLRFLREMQRCGPPLPSSFQITVVKVSWQNLKILAKEVC